MNYVYYHCGAHPPNNINDYDVCIDDVDDLKRIIFCNYRTFVNICGCIIDFPYSLNESKKISYGYFCDFPRGRAYYNIINKNYISEHKHFLVISTNRNKSGLLIYDITTWPSGLPVPVKFLLDNEQFLNNIIDGSLINFSIAAYKNNERLRMFSRFVQLLSNTRFELKSNNYGKTPYNEYFIKERSQTKRALKDSEKN